ncbi:MAG: Uma2 family endonuclease [Candidatus Scalindua sp.]|nr:Uma2 family endonuclease [Candidatus Scalindua sp.]
MKTTLKNEKIFTYKDLHILTDGNYEIIDGEKIDMAPTGFRHGKFESIFSDLLNKHLKEKGYVAVGEIGIVITREPFRLRSADVVYISKDTSPEEPEGILEIAPDLIIEILSKDDCVWKMNDKVKDYLSIGVKKIILVDSFTELITVYKYEKREALYYNFEEEFELINGINIRMKEIL